jgi:terminase small subunit / prophage DNA-packing protein
MLANSAEVAELFEVDPVTVRQWAASGCAYVKRGGKGIEWQFETAVVHRWLVQRALRQAGIGDPARDDLPSLKSRKLRADAELKEITLKRRAEDLVPLAVFMDTIREAFAGVSETLTSIASGVAANVAPLVAAETNVMRCREIIAHAINEARLKLSSRKLDP